MTSILGEGFFKRWRDFLIAGDNEAFNEFDPLNVPLRKTRY
jgi:hypothetical protein